MDDRQLLHQFWDCGDSQIIDFAIMRARLNLNEREVLQFTLDECMTQEEIAERMHFSVRRIQDFWYSGAKKILNIPWVVAYAKSLG